jgi:hypothetical protein
MEVAPQMAWYDVQAFCSRQAEPLFFLLHQQHNQLEKEDHVFTPSTLSDVSVLSNGSFLGAHQ